MTPTERTLIRLRGKKKGKDTLKSPFFKPTITRKPPGTVCLKCTLASVLTWILSYHSDRKVTKVEGYIIS